MLSLVAGAAGASLLSACGDDHSHDGEGGGTNADLADVIYEGGATDEALEALIAAGATSDAAQGTRFLTPAAGAVLDPSTPVAFTWAVGQTSASAPEASPRGRGRSRARVSPSLVERAVGSLFGVRTAHAHGTPIDGRAYFLVFRTESNPRLLRVFTTRLEYTPSAEAWAKLTGEGGGAITAEITGAIFEQNRIPQDGGPWLGETLGFEFAS